MRGALKIPMSYALIKGMFRSPWEGHPRNRKC